ncbi:MAG: putative NADPH-dependent reductase [Frankiales bacterium]|nr:putative NADPH-dependent reductase [Frankiales bacterium]
MTLTPVRIAMIIASTREGRFGPTVADWFAAQAGPRLDLDLEVLDLALAEVPSPAFTDRIAAADAFVVVTPEYNHSFPGPLKVAVDSVREQWAAKPVAFVSYGGVSGGLRAVEALRPVFAELHATTIRETVSFASYWELFDVDGRLKDPAGPDAAATALLEQLLWWAHALRDARLARPYGCPT